MAASNLKSRIDRLEQVSEAAQSGCIVYFSDVERRTIADRDGIDTEVFIGGGFTIDGRTMGIGDALAATKDYKLVTFLPARGVR